VRVVLRAEERIAGDGGYAGLISPRYHRPIKSILSKLFSRFIFALKMKNKRALEIDRPTNFRAPSEKLNFTKQLVRFWRDLKDNQRWKYDGLSLVPLREKLKLDGKPISRVPVLDFVRVEDSEKAQLLELIGRSYAEFGQVPAAAEQKAVVEIASGEPLARAWLVRNKTELIGYCIVSLTFGVRQRGRGAVLDQLYINPELRTHQMLRRVLEFIEYQAAQVGATMLDIKFAFKDKRKSTAFERIGFQNGYSSMSKQLEPWPTYYRRRRLGE